MMVLRSHLVLLSECVKLFLAASMNYSLQAGLYLKESMLLMSEFLVSFITELTIVL